MPQEPLALACVQSGRAPGTHFLWCPTRAACVGVGLEVSTAIGAEDEGLVPGGAAWHHCGPVLPFIGRILVAPLDGGRPGRA